ncbi:metallophosphoesterase family protein [Steroidobacter sp.]|uniref:metallophosphoesterase family protein n=1 Tax=Steroidobacter sp. TaxID=1978227 RepID=UPI001A4818F7|nr:metallophosphoesterase family protein [Steroidobacter sp.]MBL8265547.1 metallophosphoesterase family protein [Steroidobacter sp.]
MEAANSPDAPDQTVIGVVSDTHGLLRPEALKHLSDVERIIHAGDIGSPNVLEKLQTLAPVSAVRGNNDKGSWAEAIPESLLFEIRGHSIHVLHELAKIDMSPSAAGVAVVISGHSHKPEVEERDGVLFLNPGSLGPRRFRLPIALAKLYITDTAVRAEIIEIRLPH